MLKIMIQANANFVKSGYGQACNLLLDIFKRLGHEVAIFAYYGIEGSVMLLDNVQLFPRGHDPYGNDIVDAHMVRFGGDLLISLIDVHVLSRYGRRAFHWLPITPVDGDPLSEGIEQSLPGALHIVSMSKYGQEVLEQGGFPSTMIYLPVNTSFYAPLDKRKARAAFRWPEDAYVIGHVGMNRGYRKGIDLLISAFQYVVAEIPEARLYLHTDTNQGDGLNLDKLIQKLGLTQYVLASQRYDVFMGQSIFWMNGLYNALDLYIQPSLNEGQGMPLWEAESVGLPVVATAGTALTEVLDDADAIAVPPTNLIWNPSNTFGYEVSIQDLANAMINAYRKWGKKYVSLANRQKAIENVSLNVVGMAWQGVLNEIERRIRFAPAPMTRPWKERPLVVQISTARHNCGIAAYTQALMESLGNVTDQHLVDILTLQSPEQIPDCDLLHVHYEVSIFPSEQRMREIYHTIKQRGTRILCTFHTINPGTLNTMLTEKMIDLAVIHWPASGMEIDHSTVAVLGGMGIPFYQPAALGYREDLREQYGFPINAKIISTFGFAAVGRGQYEVLAELAPFLLSRKDIHLQLILSENAFNPIGFQYVHRQIVAITAQYGIARQVHVVRDFLPSLEILHRLWMSDVGFLYIEGETLSSSAAIRYFVAARLPLVKTHTTHFDDVRGGAVTTDPSVFTFAHAILTLLDEQETRYRLHHEHKETYDNFVWPKFGEKYLEIYKRVLGG